MVIFKQIEKSLVESILHGLISVISVVEADKHTLEYDLEMTSKTPLGVHFGATYKNLGEVSKELFGFELCTTKVIDQHNPYHGFFYEQKALNNLFLSNIVTRQISKEDWLNKAKKFVDYLHSELYHWDHRAHGSLKIVLSEKRHD